MNRAKLQLLHGRAMYDVAAAQTAALVTIGAGLGFYQALAARPLETSELAKSCGVDERYAQAWLVNQTASGYVTRQGQKFSLDEEQRALFVSGSEFGSVAAFDFSAGLAAAIPTIIDAIRHGGGVDHGTYGRTTLRAMARLDPMRPQHVRSWIGDLRFKSVCEIGCGEGLVLIHLAEQFPDARFVGCDVDDEAMAMARAEVKRRGLEDRVRFENGTTPAAGGHFDLILTIDTLHDIANPDAFIDSMAGRLSSDGTWLIAEPAADQMDVSTRLIAATAVLFCLPTSIALGGGALGALATETEYRDLLGRHGLTNIRRLDEPARCVLEAHR